MHARRDGPRIADQRVPVDWLPNDARWGHGRGVGSGGVGLHYVRLGRGDPVVLLHGWPGFWWDWRRVLRPLSEFVDVIAPDLRGFGESDRPDLPPAEGYTRAVFAEDIDLLLEQLEVERAVVAAYDIGASVAQVLARRRPSRVRALALFNPAYPGIGDRRSGASVRHEFWYQAFHALDWSDRLIAHDRETLRLYLRHFYEHWAGRKPIVSEREFEAILDAYARPGAFRASVAYYRARWAETSADRTTDDESVIEQPTVVGWGDADPVMVSAWSDRLRETFPDHELARFPGIGHFVPLEAPEQTIETIRRALALSVRPERS